MTEQLSGTGEAGSFPRPGKWQMAKVTEIRRETPNAKTFRLDLLERTAFLAGQHFIVRLTAPGGYTAQRSYSVASAPDGSGTIELSVERLPDGEVSSFLHDVVVVGDELEVRGPIGGWFIWRGDTPAVLVGGGSGVVPLNPDATGFICGSSGFADAATAVLRDGGMPVDRIRLERFGPTG